MTPTFNSNLQIPYEIGQYIATLTPNIDQADSWHDNGTTHYLRFQAGPDPSRHQLKEGLLLEVSTEENKPQALHTRYGYWKVLGASHGSFDKIFATLQKTLNLKKIEEYKHPHLSLWAIQTWKDKELPSPVRAFQREREYIPYNKAVSAYKEFKNTLFILNQKRIASANDPENFSKNPSPLVSRVTISVSNAQEKKPCESKTPPSPLANVAPTPIFSTNKSEQNTGVASSRLASNQLPAGLAKELPALPKPPSYRPSTSSTPSVVRKKKFNPVYSQPNSDTKKAEPTILMDQRSIMSKFPAAPCQSQAKIGLVSLERFAPKLPFQSTPPVPLKILQRQQPKTPSSSLQTIRIPTPLIHTPAILQPTSSATASHKKAESLNQPPAKKALTIETRDNNNEYSLYTLPSDTVQKDDIENRYPEGWQPLFHSPFNGLTGVEISR